MKNRKIKVLLIFALAVLAVLVTAVFIRRENAGKTGEETTGTNESTADNKVQLPSDVKTITFAVPDICRIEEDNLNVLNDELTKDGYGYRLEIYPIEYEEYSSLLYDECKSGNVDVAFLGLGASDGSNNIYRLIKSGLFCSLDEVLFSDVGGALYSAFPKNLWEAVKCDGHIYSVPSVMSNDSGIYAAFNLDYIDEENADSWDDTIQGIRDIVSNAGWNDKEEAAFWYLLSGYDFEDMIGCEIRHGLLFDYDTLAVYNPLESEKFIGFFSCLEEMKKEGILDNATDYLENTGLNRINVRKNIESGNYMVALGSGEAPDVFLKDNVKIVRIEPYLSSRINASIGISANTEDVNAVADFLGIFYGSEKYGNLLLYGREGEDYQVIDGFAVNPEGKPLDDMFITKLCLDLFINVCPVEGESFPENRKEAYFAYYEDIKRSPYIGFEPDTENMGQINSDLDMFLSDMSIAAGEGETENEGGSMVFYDEYLSEAKKRLEADGVESYLEDVRKQWEEFQK